MKCDFCGNNKKVFRQIFADGDVIKRAFISCPDCTLKVYNKAINILFERNEKEIGNFLKSIFDCYYADCKLMDKTSEIFDKDENIIINENDQFYHIKDNQEGE